MARPRVRPSSGAGCVSSWLSSSFLVTAAVFLSGTQAQVVGRWGQSTLLLSPSLSPSLLVISGKPYLAGQTINSNPTSSSSLSLSLSSPISDLSSPAWKTFGAGPIIAYGTALPLSATTALIFGGDATGDPNIAVQTAADSSWILSTTASLTPSWVHEANNWAGQPTRRQNFYSTSFLNGSTSTTWIYGGIPADGSGTPLSELWSLKMAVDGLDGVSLESGGGWIQTSTAAGAANPPAMYDGAAVMVPSTNGGEPSIYLVGGVQIIGQTTTISPLSTLWLYTPSASGGSWTSIATKNAPPSRRGNIALAVAGGKIWIQGGRSLDGTTVMSDGAIFDPATKVWSSTSTGGSSVWGHSAVLVGDTVVSAFGYGQNQPATSALSVYCPVNDTWLTSYVPSYAARVANPKTISSTSSLPRVTGFPAMSTSSSPSIKTSTAGSPSSTDPAATSLPSSSTHSNLSTPILIVSILASLFILGIIVLLSMIVIRRRRRRAISRAFPSPRQNGGPANWHVQAATPGSGGSLMGEGWGAGYQVEKTVPVGRRSVDGKLSILERFFRGRKSSGQDGGNDRETRFDMLRDEESDKYDSGRGRPGWKTFVGEEEDTRTELSRDWADHSEDRGHPIRDAAVNDDAYDGADMGMGDPMLTPIQEYGEEYDEEDAQFDEPGSTLGHESTSFHSHRATDSTPSHAHSNGLHSSASPSRRHSLYGASFAPSQGNTQRVAPRLSVSSSNHTDGPLTRSSTWWSRLNNLSSKAFPTSTSSERIRDPTPVPLLASFADTADPFLDHHETPTRQRTISFEPESRADELGRALLITPRRDRSMSSIDTASSSILEQRMRGMDVVMRLGGEGSDGTEVDYTPTINSVGDEKDTEEYRFGTLPERSLDEEMDVLESGKEIWNDRGRSTSSDPSTNQQPDSQLQLRPKSAEVKRVLGPRPLPPTTSSASTVGGVRSRVLSLERKLTANESTGAKSPSATSPRGKQTDRNSSGRAGHVLAKKQALYIANPDDM